MCSGFWQMTRLYYGIGDVAKRCNVPKSMIRHWLKEFHITIKKRRYNCMFFTPEDMDTIMQINYLLKVRKFTIAGAIREMEDNQYNQEIQAVLRIG